MRRGRSPPKLLWIPERRRTGSATGCHSAGDQTRQVVGRQADGSDPAGMMSGVAVKIRTTGDGKAERGGERAIPALGVGVVIRVPRLQRVQSGPGECRDPVVDPREPGMREGRDAAGAANN